MEKPKLLFTPGPLTTSEGVKQAMLRDFGSRDAEFLEVVRKIRRRLLELGNVPDGSYEAVLLHTANVGDPAQESCYARL
jgi:2-aminoethylphosphonate-pyruvate transaminase